MAKKLVPLTPEQESQCRLVQHKCNAPREGSRAFKGGVCEWNVRVVSGEMVMLMAGDRAIEGRGTSFLECIYCGIVNFEDVTKP